MKIEMTGRTHLYLASRKTNFTGIPYSSHRYTYFINPLVIFISCVRELDRVYFCMSLHQDIYMLHLHRLRTYVNLVLLCFDLT